MLNRVNFKVFTIAFHHFLFSFKTSTDIRWVWKTPEMCCFHQKKEVWCVNFMWSFFLFINSHFSISKKLEEKNFFMTQLYRKSVEKQICWTQRREHNSETWTLLISYVTSNGSFSSFQGPLFSATPPACIVNEFFKSSRINSLQQEEVKLIYLMLPSSEKLVSNSKLKILTFVTQCSGWSENSLCINKVVYNVCVCCCLVDPDWLSSVGGLREDGQERGEWPPVTGLGWCQALSRTNTHLMPPVTHSQLFNVIGC